MEPKNYSVNAPALLSTLIRENETDKNELNPSTITTQAEITAEAPPRITTDREPLNTIQLRLMQTYLSNLSDEYQCCFFLTLKSLSKLILMHQFLSAIKISPEKIKSTILSTFVSDFHALISSNANVNFSDFFKNKLFPHLKISEESKNAISKQIIFIDRILKNPNMLNDKAYLYHSSFDKIDIEKGVDIICNIQKELYTYIKPIIDLKNKNLLQCNRDLFKHKINNQPTNICDAKIEVGIRDTLITDSKAALLSIHALTETSKNSGLQMVTNLIDKDQPQMFCQQSLKLLLKPLQNFTNRISSELCRLEEYFTKIETGLCFCFKVKHTKNSKSLMRDLVLNDWKAEETYLSEIWENSKFLFLTSQAFFNETKENTLFFSILKEVLFFYRDQKTQSLEEYIKQKFLLGDKSPLLLIVNMLRQYHEKKVPKIAQKLLKSENQILNQYLSHMHVIKDDPNPTSTLCENLLKTVEELEACFKRDEKHYNSSKRSPQYLDQYFEEFFEDRKSRKLLSVQGDTVLRYFNSETIGLSDKKLSRSQKHDGIESLKLNDQMMHAINAIKGSSALLYEPFVEFLEQLMPILKDDEIDLGALWIESFEREEQEFRLLSQTKVLKKDKAAETKIKDKSIEKDEASASIPCSEHILHPTVKPVQVRKLSEQLLLGNILMSDIIALQRGNNEEQIFTYDLAYHVELFNSALDGLEIATSTQKEISFVPILSCCLNSYYYMLEQAITPKFISNITHGLVQTFATTHGANKVWNDMDKMTIWYRYPHFSLAFNRTYQRQTPVALQLTLDTMNDKNKLFLDFANLVRGSLDSLMAEVANHLHSQNDSLLHFKQQILDKIEKLCRPDIDKDEVKFAEKKISKLCQCQENLSHNLPQLNLKFKALIESMDVPPTAAVTHSDLLIHIDRFTNSLHLLNILKEQKFFHLHSHSILMAGQYLVEHCFILLSIANLTEVRSHDFKNYTELLNLEQYYSSASLNFINNYLFLKKGCDYPFWSFYSKNIEAGKGMQLLCNSFALAQAGEEFIPKGMNANSIKKYHEEMTNLIEGITSFLLETVTVVEKFTLKAK